VSAEQEAVVDRRRCICGHGYDEHDNDFISDEGCLHGWDLGPDAAQGCTCPVYRGWRL
jgi:hypothetical protein